MAQATGNKTLGETSPRYPACHSTPPPTTPTTKAAAVKAATRLKAPEITVVMSITGKASTDVQVARFIARLAAHPLTDVVDLSYSKESDDQQEKAAREFQLTVILKPDADVLDAIGREPPGDASGETQGQLTMGGPR